MGNSLILFLFKFTVFKFLNDAALDKLNVRNKFDEKIKLSNLTSFDISAEASPKMYKKRC